MLALFLGYSDMKRKATIVLAVVALLFACDGVTSSLSANPVCKQLESAARALRCGAATLNRRHVGAVMTGKRAPRSVKEDTGPAGSPGQIDYDRIDALNGSRLMAEPRRYSSDVTSLSIRIEAMEALLRRAEERLDILEQREGVCEFKYGGKCFYIVVYDRWIPGYDTAVGWCTEQGGSPANIYSKRHYQLVMRQMRAKILTGKNAMHLWLGMKVNPMTGTATLSDGRPAPFVKWYPNSFRRDPIQNRMVIDQRITGEIGMHNMAPSATREGILCEI